MDYANELINRSFRTKEPVCKNAKAHFDFVARCIESCNQPVHIPIVRSMIQNYEVLHGPDRIEDLCTLLYIKAIMVDL